MKPAKPSDVLMSLHQLLLEMILHISQLLPEIVDLAFHNWSLPDKQTVHPKFARNRETVTV